MVAEPKFSAPLCEAGSKLDRLCTPRECDDAINQFVFHGVAALDNGDPFQAWRMFSIAKLWAVCAQNREAYRKARDATRMLRRNHPHEFVGIAPDED